LLSGEQDVWLASCSGFYSSPFAKSGEACPVPFWGCLECRNGVITSRKLPALMAFLDFVVDQRKVMTKADWQAKFGLAHRRIGPRVRSPPVSRHRSTFLRRRVWHESKTGHHDRKAIAAIGNPSR